MLDGLLGKSGFYSKCKSLIKQTRTRIEVVRRKRNATQKFLRKDIADLLANGLEKNAYGRADGLISELILSSCYEFIDHVCEIILKHLPVLQKLRECPEDCREAVASVMFAAARFSDLPELRELRDLFQGRYGSSVEYYVNQKLVENITPKPPSMEKNIKLLEEIASEFTLRWDSRGFEERMASSSMTEQKHQRIPETPQAAQVKVSAPLAKEAFHRTVKDEVLPKKKSEATPSRERQVDDRHQMESRRDCILERKDELKYNVSKAPELTNHRYKPPSYREDSIQKREDHDNYLQGKGQKADRRVYEDNSAKEAIQVGNSSHGKRLESVHSQHKLDRHRQDNVSESDVCNTLSQRKPDQRPASNGISSPSSMSDVPAENIHVKSMRKKQEDEVDGLKSNFRGGVPPPYVKPRKSKHKVDAEENDTLTFYPTGRPEKPPTKPDFPDAHENLDSIGRVTEVYYKDEAGVDSTPRRRSHRRKYSRSTSSQDGKVKGEVGKEERVLRRVSTSRRKHESRKGLQIVFDDDHYRKDDEESMIDQLLLHYSKKPSSSDPGNPRRETKNRTRDVSKSPVHKAKVGTYVGEEDLTPRRGTSRSMSFPPRQVTQPEPQKVFARAASFQQEIPAKHVHPKLPDYDDLAARFAALRASQD
ncbi:hypothetical protein SOVF_205720 [Spinacia oleracea]|uniref:IST1-like protein n=1 Tax=Spinacia oleracea TaxID=3562 RepID=A0A9R0JIV6_SPIOL|nr:uncharacterized protein LOC110806123 [Spinacia oleracea]KNA03793.1 hypothetical protein SOVF_205720 [Spinacia oleracea]